MVDLTVEELQDQIEEICDKYENGDETVYRIIDEGKPVAMLVKYRESQPLSEADKQFFGEIGYT